MKPNEETWALRYEAALGLHLKAGASSQARQALELGREAAADGVSLPDLARIHASAVDRLRPGITARDSGRSARFFAAAIEPLVFLHRTSLHYRAELARLGSALSRRTLQLASSRLEFRKGAARNRVLTEQLRDTKVRHAGVEAKTRRVHDELRRLTRRMLKTQERRGQADGARLRNDIAQSMIGINLWLRGLRTEARRNTESLATGISKVRMDVSAAATKVGTLPSPSPKS
jgi:hypothetical protein